MDSVKKGKVKTPPKKKNERLGKEGIILELHVNSHGGKASDTANIPGEMSR